MGIKKSTALNLLGFAMAMSATTEDFNITERGKVGNGKKSEPKKVKPLTPFAKRDGVLKLIEEYNLIAKGKSKKGILKQSRIKAKVDKWLMDGWLKEEDLI